MRPPAGPALRRAAKWRLNPPDIANDCSGGRTSSQTTHRCTWYHSPDAAGEWSFAANIVLPSQTAGSALANKSNQGAMDRTRSRG